VNCLKTCRANVELRFLALSQLLAEINPGVRLVLTNTAWLSANQITRLVIGLAVGVLVVRHLGPEQFGRYSFALALVAIVGSLSALAADSVVTREVVADPNASGVVLGSQFVLRMLGSVFAVAITLIVSCIQQESSETVIVAVVAASLLFAPFEGIAIWFHAEQRPKAAVQSKLIAFLVASFIRLLFVFGGASVIAFAALFSVEAALSATALVVVYNRHGERLGSWNASRTYVTKLFHDSWPLLFAGISSILYMKLDVVMLNEMRGAHETGIYGAATRVSEAWNFVPMALVGALQPVLLRTKRDDPALFIKRMEMLYMCTAWSSLAVAVIISMLSTSVVKVLFGHEYQQSGSVLALHTWSAIAIYLGVVSSQYLLAENLLKISMFRTMLGLATNIVLNLALIPQYGAQGAAVATVVSYFVATFSLFLFESTRSHAASMIRAFNPVQAMKLFRSPRSLWAQ
jgi:PST family polysaccharide transporter